MHKVLDGALVRYKEKIDAARKNVLTVEGKSVKTELKSGGMSFDDFLEEADYSVIEDAYRRAARAINPDLATTYSEHLAGSQEEEELIDAHVTVAALGLVPEIKDHVEAEAEKLANQWLQTHRVAIKSLSDERQEVYRQIREMSIHPLDVDLARPTSWIQSTTIREADGAEKPLPTFDRHLLSDESGLFPGDFNSWEDKVLAAELNRPGTIAWYRNPSRTTQDSLGVTYEDAGEIKIVRPDFILFAQLESGVVVADIVDPHGIQFGDALPKLRGLAKYAEANGSSYRRIEAVAKIGEKFRALDLTEVNVRSAVAIAKSTKEIYESDIAVDYLA
jgi:hypothetical protein